MSRNVSQETVAVVGGGITGIASALALAQREIFRVALYEKSSSLGGLSASYKWEDILCDKFYHVILPSDHRTMAFLNSLGFKSEIFWQESKSGFFGNNRLVSFSSSLNFIRFPFLNLRQKARLGLGIIQVSRLESPATIEKLSAEEWLIQIFGKDVYENFWEPLLSSKLGEAKRTISAAFMWATIRRLNKARSRAKSKEHLGYIKGGYSAVLRAAETKLNDLGVDIYISDPVQNIYLHGKKISLESASGSREFDKILLAIPDPEISRISQDLKEDPSRWRTDQSDYLGIICLLLILRCSLSPYYIINLLDKNLSFTGIIESTNIIPPEFFGGSHLVYLPKYILPNDPLVTASDAHIQGVFLESLKKVYPPLRETDILHMQVFREPYVQSLFYPKHQAKRQVIRTLQPGIYIANSSCLHDSTLNNNAVLEVAEEAVRCISADKILRI